MKKLAILGATGLVGQRFVQLLSGHPFFEISVLAASDNSSGKKYGQAVHWHLETPVLDKVKEMVVRDCRSDFEADYVLSALPSDVAGPIEEELASAGYIVFSNAANHRLDQNVPIVVPEINLDHLNLIQSQQTKGKIITNPNCSTTGLVMALKPIMDRFGLEEIKVVTMQAVSGAGYPGVASLDIVDNIIPYIKNEEEKIVNESKKILGKLKEGYIDPASFSLEAQCNRVPVVDGHLLSVFVKTSERVALDKVIKAFEDFAPLGGHKLPAAPERPVIYWPDMEAPQPRLHRNSGGGMSVSIGRLVKVAEKQIRFVALVHNTIRGAAGCALLNAEAYDLLMG
ncbi:MAG: aspartate-semialdehyde dehydrogenase [Acidobacteriota bacterium]|nr:aspartate-semialdehyde dehydrogenase [Acidobacteriota bacterium]